MSILEQFRNYPSFLHCPEQLQIEPLPEFDKSQYSDPEYLIGCRWWANQFFLAARKSFSRSSNLSDLSKVAEWNQAMGIEKDGHHQGLLLEEEVLLILKHRLEYPLPWNSERAQEEFPLKYDDSAQALFNISIPASAEKGTVVGITGMTADIFHAGYAAYLRKCKESCDVLVVGIDGNDLAQANRENHPNRPYNDFPVRLGTISEMPEVDVVFRISQLDLDSDPQVKPYTLYFYPLAYQDQIRRIIDQPDLLEKAIADFKRGNPNWHEEIGPNLRFFWSEGDPAHRFKMAGAALFGAQPVVLPKFTHSVSSTAIGKHFSVQKRSDQTNRFGVPSPHQIWQTEQVKRIFGPSREIAITAPSLQEALEKATEILAQNPELGKQMSYFTFRLGPSNQAPTSKSSTD